MPEDGKGVLVCGVHRDHDGNYVPFVDEGYHSPAVYVGDDYYKSYEEPKDDPIPKWVIEGISCNNWEDWNNQDWGTDEYREGDDYIVTSWAPWPDVSEEALKLLSSKP